MVSRLNPKVCITRLSPDVLQKYNTHVPRNSENAMDENYNFLGFDDSGKPSLQKQLCAAFEDYIQEEALDNSISQLLGKPSNKSQNTLKSISNIVYKGPANPATNEREQKELRMELLKLSVLDNECENKLKMLKEHYELEMGRIQTEKKINRGRMQKINNQLLRLNATSTDPSSLPLNKSEGMFPVANKQQCEIVNGISGMKKHRRASK